ncbi:MAG: ABC transporter ATP-binding protein [Halobacteriota archaeon]|nr:ABC transporter ATP-binding protein [Halobacteriota archaeon]
MIIELKDVTKIYDMGKNVIRALDHVFLEVEEGEFVTLMGPSGSGKSTLLNMLGCLDVPTEGEIIIDGSDISELQDEELTKIRRDKIGFVFQKFNLIPTLTAGENVELPMIFQKIPPERCHERAIELFGMVNLEVQFLDHLPSELSSGQQQRVAIARALANDPLILLADEPTGNLDTKTGKSIMELLRVLNEKGRTIIVVTHDPRLSEYSKRTMRIVDGGLGS